MLGRLAVRSWRHGLLALLALSSLLAAPPAHAQFAALETDDLLLVYFDPTGTYLSPYAARCFENSMRFQRQLFGYKPWDKVTVFVHDFSDDGNASASPISRNFLSVEMSPSSFAYETYPSNERINTLMNHELVHIAAFDGTARRDRGWRHFFLGKVAENADHPETILYNYLTVPRMSAPRWYHEGIAVFVETWMAAGIGRAQGSYDEMVFRSMVKDDARFYSPLGLVSEGTKIDFQVEMNSYLYGTRFMSYLADVYSPEQVVRWVARTDGSRAYYGSQFRSVFGLPLETAWEDWIRQEHAFQQKNLDAIHKYPLTSYEDLSAKALGSVSRAFYDGSSKTLYAAFNYPGVVAHVGAISLADGTMRRIHDVKGPVIHTVTSLAFDPDTKTLFYTADNGSMRDLMSLDPATRKAKLLMKDARIGDLVFDRADRSLWGIRQSGGLSTLVQLPYPYKEWKSITTWDFGTIPYDLDLSADGRLLSASIGGIDGKHRLEVMTVDALKAGDTTAIAQFDFGTTIPSNFVFSDDGKYLYGSSYYTGVSNIFRFEIATKDLQAVSNCETGMFRPLPMGGDALVVFRYTGAGFVPARIAGAPLQDVSAITYYGQQLVEKRPVLKTWTAGSPKDIPLDTMITRQGPYRSFGWMGIESLYPIIEGYKDTNALGVAGRFSDPIYLNKLSFSASYSVDGDLDAHERYHLALRYQRYNFRAVFRKNSADFYDLFGPTKTSRKGYVGAVGYTKSLIFDEPRVFDLDLSGAYYAQIDTLPDYQNVAAPVDTLTTAEAKLSYRNLRASLGAVDYEKGLKAEAILGASHVSGRNIPSLIGNFDIGLPLPISHSSVWLRTSAGAAHGDREDPFANFFFGGFGNNYVDHGEIKRYRMWYAFPGVPLNAVGGRSFGKAMVEWNLPPLRFRSVGSPSFYLTWARASLFASALETDPNDSEFRRRVGNAGTQIDLRFTALARHDLTLSFGYAAAFETGGDSDREALVSLKILR